MKTPEELAQQYCDEVYHGDIDFYDEALEVINFLLEKNIIISKEYVQKDYKTCTDFCEQAKQIDKNYWLGRKVTYEGFVNRNILYNEENY